MIKKLASMLLLIVMLICMFIVPCFAHSGGTDANGGHYDSTTGKYHYHCGGNPAHQHTNGVCPYDGDSNNSEDKGMEGGGLLYNALLAGTVGVIITGIAALINWLIKGGKKKEPSKTINKTQPVVQKPQCEKSQPLNGQANNQAVSFVEEKEQVVLLEPKQEDEEKSNAELSDEEKLKFVEILNDSLLYADELGKKEILQKYFVDFSCDALNYLVPNELEEFDVKAFALFYISGAYLVLRKLYIDAHPEAENTEDMHEIKEFEELKLLVISVIVTFPPKENEELTKYAAMVIALSQADNETDYNYILSEFGRNIKVTYVDDWLSRAVLFIENTSFETVKKNKYTKLDFLVYFIFTSYTTFCTAKNQKSAEEYSKLTFHWFMENIPSDYELDLEFAEEFYWNRTEAYNKVMMSNSDMKEAALAQTYQQFISKDNTNEPFEKSIVVGNFMETFNYSVEASTLISTINDSLFDYFKKICDEFE